MQGFYAGCFDFELLEHHGDFAVLGSEHWELSLVEARDEGAPQMRVTSPPLRREGVPVKLGFVVDSIEAKRPMLQRLGGSVDDPSTEWEFRGTRRCDAVDPEGNVIQLLQPSGSHPTSG